MNAVNVTAEACGKLVHFACLTLGHESGGLIAADIALLPEAVQSGYFGGRPADGQRKTLDGAIVVLFARSAVTCCSKRRSRCLQRRVVSDVEFPVFGKTRQPGIGKIALDDGEQRCDSSALVLCATSQLFFCQSRKLTLISDQKDFLALQHTAHKMVLRRKLGAQLRGRINR